MSTEHATRRSLGSLPLISLVLVACATTGDGAGNSQGQGTDPDDLVGVVWVLHEAAIAALVDVVPPGAHVTLSFEDGQAHGSAACNSYGGTYRAGDDGSLSFGGFAVTQMACDPPVMTLESAYLEVLAGVTGFEVGSGGDLSLSNGEATLSFSRDVPPEASPLVGTAWTLTSISSGDAVTSIVSGTEITTGFAPDETVSGSAGCNRFHGTYTWAGDRLSFSSIATTKMACADYVMAQEGVFLDAMGEVASYAIDGTQLTLLDGSGANLLGFAGSLNEQSAG
jgi:heat shock protein HslJ